MVLDLKIAELPALLGAPLCGLPFELLDCPVDLLLDSRRMIPGALFWALKGERFDGHHYAAQALQEGAAAVVVDEAWVKEHPGTLSAYLPVRDTGEALLRLAAHYSDRFSLHKVAITGSNGKTTTKEMLHAILSRRWSGWATKGNFNNHIGVPLTLFGLQKKHRFAVVEMGTNHPGEIALLTETVRPEIAVITTIGDSHLEFFQTRANVFKEKRSIARGLQEGGWLVVNGDDPFLSKLRSTNRYNLLTYGIQRGEISPKNLRWDESACAHFKLGRTDFHLATPGEHSLSNALAAIAVAHLLRIPKREMAAALAEFRGADLRMQLRSVRGFRIVADCYNANPSSMEMALKTVGSMSCSGRRIAVLGDMLELGSEGSALHAALGALVVEMGFQHLVTVGSLAHHLGKAAVAAGLSSSSWDHFADASKAAEQARSLVARGDLVLVKASRGIGLESVVDVLEKREALHGH